MQFLGNLITIGCLLFIWLVIARLILNEVERRWTFGWLGESITTVVVMLSCAGWMKLWGI